MLSEIRFLLLVDVLFPAVDLELSVAEIVCSVSQLGFKTQSKATINFDFLMGAGDDCKNCDDPHEDLRSKWEELEVRRQ